MGALATAYVQIRPDVTGFQASVASSISGAAGAGIKVPASVDDASLASQAKTVFSDLGNNAGSWFSDNFKTLLKSAGLFIGIAEGYNILKEAVSGAVALQTQQAQTNLVFGQSADVVTKFADTSVTKLGQSTEAALALTNQFGLMFTGFGVGQAQAATDATELATDIGKISSATGASVADVSSAVDSALRGRATALKDYGVVVDAATLQQKALADGLIKPATNQNAIAIAAAQVATLRTALTGAAPDAAKLTNAQMALNVAQTSQAATLEKYPATSTQAVAAAKRVFDAQQAIAKLESTSALDPVQKAADQAKLNDAVAAYNKLLLGTLPTLTAAQTAQETLSIIQSQTALDPAFGSTGSASDAFAEFTAALDNAKTALGTGLLPDLTLFANWVAQHGPDIANVASAIGQDLGSAIGDIGTAVGFVADHQTVFEAVALTIGGMFVASKVKDWTQAVTGIPGLLNSVIRTILGLPGVGGAASTTGTVATTTEFATAVTEFQAAVTEFAASSGVGGVERGVASLAPEAAGATEVVAGTTVAAGTTAIVSTLLGTGAVIVGAATLGDALYQHFRGTNQPQDLAALISGGGTSGLPGNPLGGVLANIVGGGAQGVATLQDFAKTAASEGQTKLAQEYTDLASLVEQGKVTTASELQYWVDSGEDYYKTLTALNKAAALNLPLLPVPSSGPSSTLGPGFSADAGASVSSQYGASLNRSPDAAGGAFWAKYLQDNGMEQFEAAFAASANNPLTGEKTPAALRALANQVGTPGLAGGSTGSVIGAGGPGAPIQVSLAPGSAPAAVPPVLTDALTQITTYLAAIAGNPPPSTTVHIGLPPPPTPPQVQAQSAHTTNLTNRGTIPASTWPANLSAGTRRLQ